MCGGGGPYSDTGIYIRAINQTQKFEFRISIKYSGQLGIHTTSDYPYDGFITLYNETTGTIPIGTHVYRTNNIYKGTVNLKFCNGSTDPLRTGTIVSGTFDETFN